MSRAAPLLPFFLLLAACTGDPTPGPLPEVTQAATTAGGAWTWSAEGLACASFAGMLSPADGNEVFAVTQEGERLRASFTDRAGNAVTLEGTVRRGVVEATFVVRAPARAPAPRPLSHDRPIAEGKAYVASAGDDAVYAFDLRLGALLAVVPVPGGDPGRPCVHPSGTTVFVPLPGDDAVALLDTASDRVVADFRGPGLRAPAACTTDPAGTTLFVATAAGDLVRTDIASRTVLDTVALPGTGASDLCFGPDGRTLYVVQRDSSTLVAFDTVTGSVRDVPTSPGPVSVAVAHGARGSLLVAGAGGLDVVDPATLARATLPLPGFDVAVTPDGGTAYVTRTAGPDLAAAVDLATLRVIASFRGPAAPGRGLALCGGGSVPLVALGDAYPAVILDPFDGSVFDNFALGGEHIVVVGDETAAARETVFAIEGSAAGAANARRASGSLRILKDTSPLATACVGGTRPWSATIR